MAVKPTRRRKTATEYSGGGDAVRSLELLWGARKRPSRGPKPGLSLDQIVRAAIELADGEGLSALSMQRVAGKLGFTTMSLYRYVPSKAELLDLMLDTVAGELPLVDDVPGGWRAKLEAAALADWALYHRHPWFLHVTPVRPVMVRTSRPATASQTLISPGPYPQSLAPLTMRWPSALNAKLHTQ